MKRRKVADRGDMIAIPTTDGREVFAQICWASDYYKDTIQLAFVTCRTETELQGDLTFVEPTVFSSSAVVRKGRWRKLFTHRQLYEPSPPVFYSAGNIHRGDDFVREAKPEERNTLLNLSALGAALVEKKATEIASSIHNA
jgi:hypothetical protein